MAKSFSELQNSVQQNLQESSISRIFQHIENDKSFGVVSAFRGDYSTKENMERHGELKEIVRDGGYGFIEMRGGYNGDEGFVQELSLFVPQVSRKDIIKMGQEFDQHSVIYKDSGEFSLIGTNEAAGVGKVLTNFIRGGKKNLDLAKDSIKDFFSSILKGKDRGKKFVFRVEEREINSFNRAAYARPDQKELKWFPIIEESFDMDTIEDDD
jgi:hypothetical protein